MFGGGHTANPSLSEVGGIGNMVSPPWTTAEFKLNVTFDGQPLAPEGYHWFPGEFHRWADLDEEVRIETLLVPLAEARGVTIVVHASNTGDRGRG